MSEPQTVALNSDLLGMLACPLTRSPLRQVGDELVASSPPEAGLRYPIRDGIPVLLIEEATLPDGIDSLNAFKAKYTSFVAPPA